MANFIDLHQGSELILVNVESVQTVAPHLGGRPGSQVIFHDGAGIEVDKTVEGYSGSGWSNLLAWRVRGSGSRGINQCAKRGAVA